MYNRGYKQSLRKRPAAILFPRIPIWDKQGRYRGTWGINDLMASLVLMATIVAIPTMLLVSHIDKAYADAPHFIDNIPTINPPGPYDPNAAWDNQPTVQAKIVAAAKYYGVNPQRALKVAFCESSYDPSRVNQNHNGTNDKGIFQINSIHNVPDACRLDENCNIAWAMQTIQSQGYWPWVASESCWK